MKTFTDKIFQNLDDAIEELVEAGSIQSAIVESYYAVLRIEHFELQIRSPMDDALQLTITNMDTNKLVSGSITENVKDVIPLKRLILSLVGEAQREMFNEGWDGYYAFDVDSI